MKKTTKNYVDNKKLHAEMSKYIALYKKAKAEGTQLPKVSNYIGECIWLIANGLSSNRNFAGYTYRDEMIGDGIENTLKYLHNFDPEKYDNPFGYFTQIIYYAFLRRIDKEKKQSYIKYKSMENAIAMNNLVEMHPSDASHFAAITSTMDLEKLTAMAERYEGSEKKKKEKKLKGVEKFIGEEDEQQE